MTFQVQIRAKPKPMGKKRRRGRVSGNILTKISNLLNPISAPSDYSAQMFHSNPMLNNQHLYGNEFVPQQQHWVAGGVASEAQPFPAALGIDRLSMASSFQGAYNPVESSFSLNASNSNQPQERGATEWDQSVPPDGASVPMFYVRDG